MGQVAQVLQNGDEMKKQAVPSTTESWTEELNAAKWSQKVASSRSSHATTTRRPASCSSRSQSHVPPVRQACGEDALEEESVELKDKKNDLRDPACPIEHTRMILRTEVNLRLVHTTEFAPIKTKLEERNGA
ncbi:hypothetical protein GN244_ATG10090 [Phytophthora infestans]|uniref:Uncharacterized protein n=1 Tax=Phytophthora infestans TaxID=4787 RepID=A0A833WD20_PHYIN|nr:hypothetical protein GN244_ATG10090 [Phytophthora infestans]